MSKILVISPYLGDAEFGAGASISKWIEDGHEILYFGLTTPSGYPTKITEQECLEAAMYLGIPFDNLKLLDQVFTPFYFSQATNSLVTMLTQYRRTSKPKIVLLPHPQCSQDYDNIYKCVLDVFGTSNTSILTYQNIGAYLDSFRPNYFVAVSKHNIEKKQNAASRYRRLAKLYNNKSMYELFATVAGQKIGTAFAEEFELVKGSLEI